MISRRRINCLWTKVSDPKVEGVHSVKVNWIYFTYKWFLLERSGSSLSFGRPSCQRLSSFTSRVAWVSLYPSCPFLLSSRWFSRGWKSRDITSFPLGPWHSFYRSNFTFPGLRCCSLLFYLLISGMPIQRWRIIIYLLNERHSRC